MNKLAFLLVTAALFGSCFAQDANKTQVATNTKNVTIIGTIKNFDEFKAAVVPETYIQLVPLPADGRLGGTTDSQGRPAYNSGLPKLSVPKDAAFSFHLPNLPPGRYFIAAQRLKPATLVLNGAFVISAIRVLHGGFLVDEQHVFILVVDAGDQSPRTIAAGDLIVHIH